MKTKEEIEEVMDDNITIGQCFYGEIPTEEDMALSLATRRNIKVILTSEESIAVSSKRIFEEVLSMDFNEKQWYALTMVLIKSIEYGKQIGDRRTLQFLSDMERF